MKRVGGLIEQIAAPENLYYAYYKAAKSKVSQPSVQAYCKNLDKNVQQLHTQLLTGNIQTGNYHYFKIHDPKERLICAAPFSERVMHHAIMNICHPVFERHLIEHTCATRPGKGTYAALGYAKTAVEKYHWVAKLDIRKYFDSIPHPVLKQKLARLFKDRMLLKVFSSIIDSYNAIPGKGIPIGNLTSQYFANYFLSDADHFVLEKLKVPVFIRYMDDMLLFANNKSDLKETVHTFIHFLEHELQLTVKPIYLNTTLLGVPFLGYRMYPSVIKLNTRSKIRFKHKLKMYDQLLNNEIWTQKEYSRHIQPLISFTQHADSANLRRAMIDFSMGNS